MGVGGKFYDVGKSRSLSFQPLSRIDDEDERQWALDWLCDYLREEGVEVTPDQKSIIRDSLATVAGMQESDRTMTTFISFLQSRELKTAFYPMSLADDQGNKGEYGEIFDSNEDHLSITSWQSFEMETLMNARRIVGTTLMYIFHRIEQVVKSAEKKNQEPTLIVLDECWVFFQNPMFAEKIKEWLKTLRKYNTSVLFATQSLDDIAKSPILDTVLSSCQSRIFLPDKLAITESRMELYRQFGLNKQQIHLLAHAQPQREYYYDSPQGSRLYNLALDLWMKRIFDNIKVSEGEISDFYNKNKAEFAVPAQVRAKHILVATEKDANDIIAALKGLKGDELVKKFEELAKSKSTDQGSAANGGELGWFGQSQMVKPFADAAFALKKGEVTQKPVKSNFGYHVILKEDSKAAGTVALNDVKPQIEGNIKMEKFRNDIRKRGDELRSKAKVEYK